MQLYFRFGSKFCVGSWVLHETPEKSQRTHRSKRFKYNYEDENNSPNTLSDDDNNNKLVWAVQNSTVDDLGVKERLFIRETWRAQWLMGKKEEEEEEEEEREPRDCSWVPIRQYFQCLVIYRFFLAHFNLFVLVLVFVRLFCK